MKFMLIFFLVVSSGFNAYGQEVDDTLIEDGNGAEEEPDVPSEADESSASVDDLCSLDDLDKSVDLLMGKINSRIPITYELPDRPFRTMTFSDISVSNLNTLVRYRPSVVACPGDGKVILTVPMRSQQPVVGLYRWDLKFPRGVGGRLSISIADLDVDAVIQFDQDTGLSAKLKDLKVMRLDGISVQSTILGGLLGRIADKVATLLVSNFRGLFRNFVQKELSAIIAKEMIQIPFEIPDKHAAS